MRPQGPDKEPGKEKMVHAYNPQGEDKIIKVKKSHVLESILLI